MLNKMMQGYEENRDYKKREYISNCSVSKNKGGSIGSTPNTKNKVKKNEKNN